MNFKSIIYLLTLIGSLNCFGQNKVGEICDLENKNTEWKTTFEKTENNELKLKLIREKIIFDTIYTESKSKLIYRCGPTIFNETVDRNGNNCGIKILFALNYTKKKFMILDLNKNPEYIFIVEKLNELNVQKIYTILDRSAQAIYGIRGESGAVILTTLKKEFTNEIKEFLKKSEKNKKEKKPNG